MTAHSAPVAALANRTEWFADLRKLLTADELDLAMAIYPFEEKYQDGLTPKEAYDDFDRWTSE